MKKNIPLKMKFLSTSLLFLFCSLAIVQAQTDPKSICKEGDCSPAIFNIKMNEPSEPIPAGNFTKERTDRFKQAWLSFQNIKKGYAESSEWKAKYKASQLGGKSCLRHYQFESYFANEYVQNADFKKFVDSQASNADNYLENGFESSRKGLNLERRMKRNCPDEFKEVEKAEGPSLVDLPKEYQKQGQQLGYFDEKGNILKPLPVDEKPQKKLSKRKQVEQLKQRVSQLPAGSETKQKVDNIAQDLEAAKPKSKKLGSFLKKMLPMAAALLAPQLPLVANLGKLTNVLGNLLSWKPKLPRLGLLDKIKGLFNKGKKLKDKAADVMNKSNKWQDKVKDLGKKAEKIQNDIEDKIKDVAKIKDELADLQKKKEELVDKLEDRPRRILDELNGAVSDIEKKAKKLVDKAEDASKAKDKLLEELAALEKEKDKLLAEKEQLEKDVKDLGKADEALQKDTDEVAKEVKEAQKEEEELKKKKTALEKLPSEEKLNEALTICEDDLKRLLLQIDPIAETQKKLNKKMDELKDKPKNLFEKLKNLKLFQEKLKIPKVDIPIADKTLAKVDGLLAKAGALGDVIGVLTGKKTKLQEKIEGLDGKFTKVQAAYGGRAKHLEKLKGDLITIIADRSGLKEKFEKASGNVEDINQAYEDFIKKYNIFEADSKCIDQKELEEKIEELKKEQQETEPEVEKLEEDLNKANEAEEQLEEETKKVEELKNEEEAIKEEFGQDVELEPVTAEEWVEDFEVKRQYWDAVFHPDDEVVEGYKGRYFKISLKDAEKNVKLLFGPGEYFMKKSDFRDNYGSVIGAFVTEALHSLKKSEKGMVKLFVQGSADIVGQNTFRGKLDSKYFYDEVTVLPQNPETDGFSGTPALKSISKQSFTNTELPDLRGNFLKEMISIYSKKLEPILLEGSVKEAANKGDRNAVIYLFIPEELVTKYEED